MNVFEYLIGAYRFGIRSLDDYNDYQLTEIPEVSKSITLHEFMKSTPELVTEDQYHYNLPKIWLRFELPAEPTEECNYYIQSSTYLGGALLDDELAEESQLLIESLGKQAYVPVSCSVWKGVDGILEYTLLVNHFRIMFNTYNGHEPTLFLINKVLAKHTVEDDYVKFILNLLAMAQEQYQHMANIGQDKYYAELETAIPPQYRTAYCSVSHYEEINGDISSPIGNVPRDYQIEWESLENIPSVGTAVTKQTLLEACQIAMNAIMEDDFKIDDTFLMLRTDAINESIVDIDDSTTAFDDWYKRPFGNTCFVELIFSGSKSNAVFLQVNRHRDKDKGYYYVVRTGSNSHNIVSAVKMAIALQQSGYPVMVPGLHQIKERFNKNSLVLFPSIIDLICNIQQPQRLDDDTLIEWADELSPAEALRNNIEIKFLSLKD